MNCKLFYNNRPRLLDVRMHCFYLDYLIVNSMFLGLDFDQNRHNISTGRLRKCDVIIRHIFSSNNQRVINEFQKSTHEYTMKIIIIIIIGRRSPSWIQMSQRSCCLYKPSKDDYFSVWFSGLNDNCIVSMLRDHRLWFKCQVTHHSSIQMANCSQCSWQDITKKFSMELEHGIWLTSLVLLVSSTQSSVFIKDLAIMNFP